MNAQPNATFLSTVWPESRDSFLRLGAVVVLGTLLLTASAKIQVPFWPVPMTMQTFMVLFLGAALGPRLGALTVLLYLTQGAAGLPVFAGTPEKGLGIAYMAGPTGGYLLGFTAGAYVVGWLAERGWDRSVLRLFAAMALGHVVIFAFGVAWLTQLVGLEKAWLLGVTPFYAATLFKTALGACLMPALWQLAKR
ncbi:MAG TPA: biotin transporter BioY [Hyphomicrobiaceae bacterium]|jgi:biotin transport system substrate-specific component